MPVLPVLPVMPVLTMIVIVMLALMTLATTAAKTARVIKVKAHQTLRQDMGQDQKLCVIGNNYADKRAKWGVEKTS